MPSDLFTHKRKLSSAMRAIGVKVITSMPSLGWRIGVVKNEFSVTMR